MVESRNKPSLNTTHEGKLRVTGSGDFSMSLAVKVDQLEIGFSFESSRETVQ